MRVAVLACVAMLCGVGAAHADAAGERSQARDLQSRLRACSEIIAEPGYGIDEKAVASPNRTDARAGAKNKPLADFKHATLRPDQATSYATVPIVDVGDARKGLAYAEKFCSACHNVLATDATSPNKQAPPFKSIAKTPGMSITALTVWSRTSHPTMPNFVIAPEDMDDLIAYIMSLRNR